MSADGHLPLNIDTDLGLDIRRVGGRIGAEVAGVNLSADLPDDTLQAIEKALLRHKVLFFRDQHHLDDQGQEAFAPSAWASRRPTRPCRCAKAPSTCWN
jgi:hypothetical protein